MFKHLFFLLPIISALGLAQQPVTLEFQAVVGDAPLVCGRDYPGVGAADTTISLQDARLYVSNFRLLDAKGGEVPLTLEQDSLWQHENVALLDFENATGGCAEVGTKATNNRVVGTVPAGEYRGLVFDLGVPFALNHADATTAPSPLNVTSLWWSWQGGYKFARIELLNEQEAAMSDGPAPSTAGGMDMSGRAGPPANFWPIHLGSLGCDAPAPVVSPVGPCERPNLGSVRLATFRPGSDTVTLDLAALLEGVDVGRSLELAPPGCMSGFDDPDCAVLMGNLGVSLTTGAGSPTQRLFGVAGEATQAGR